MVVFFAPELPSQPKHMVMCFEVELLEGVRYALTKGAEKREKFITAIDRVRAVWV